jgi:methylenetetrahydrofolate--tRNA-(uracil-5-)-methyltransferase
MFKNNLIRQSDSSKPVVIIGGGLAGCEAAWQLSKRGISVALFEMKPEVFSPAHKTEHLAELVCSNSLRSNAIENAVGLLKEEMRVMDSLIMEAADATSVPAGGALAVDRNLFSPFIEAKLCTVKTLDIVRKEVVHIPDDFTVIIATGPLTSDAMAKSISTLTGSEYLYFYDAISPVVYEESINHMKTFKSSRYGKGSGDYINCPLTKEEYERFWHELMDGEEVSLRDFEDKKCFEGCLPIEVIARRGIDTLAFGPMKPVGLVDPHTGKQPHAVVQLRQENRKATLFNMVGFQTKLTWPEQKRIFRIIPGLERADFARYGSIHRNTFINSPALLEKSLQLRSNRNIFFCGQITGVEGYVESAASGLLAGISVFCHLSGGNFPIPPQETGLGALIRHITKEDVKNFQPMNVNFGLFPPLPHRTRKRERGKHYATRSLQKLNAWKDDLC